MHEEVILLLRVVNMPNVCTYFDRFKISEGFGQKKKKKKANPVYCIMLDFIDGQDLKHYIRDGGEVDDSIVYGFFRSILQAIAALHADQLWSHLMRTFKSSASCTWD